ncbi:ribbon-helix-helix domain-containing protein [Methylorubrum sp. SB2]|uniref:ribbon-helix-helix domain-containing protein n=1 Tax=Methylorubrum subtropicum TaxID=3138812 RepID=UPI00313C9E2C
MAKKPASLEAALGGYASQDETAGSSQDSAEIVRHPAAAARTPTVKLTAYVPPAASKRLKMMCIEHDRDVNSYLREGLDMVLEKYGQPSLAEFAKK